MAGEDRLREYLFNNVDGFGHWFRIESHEVSPGVPDLHVTLRGTSRFIELKHGTRKKPPYFRPTQYVWFRREVEAGGNPLTLVCIQEEDPTFALLSGQRSLDIHTEMVSRPSIEPWIRPVSGCRVWAMKINWDEFLRLVLNPALLEEKTND